MNDNSLAYPCCNERDAYYQAGHAVIALEESLEVVRVYFEADGSSWMDIKCPDLTPSRLNRSVRARSDAKSVIRALLAGPAALSRYSFGAAPAAFPFQIIANRTALEDEAASEAIALAANFSNDTPALIDTMWRRVSGRINDAWSWLAIQAVAQSLLLNGELAGCEISAIIQVALKNHGR